MLAQVIKRLIPIEKTYTDTDGTWAGVVLDDINIPKQPIEVYNGMLHVIQNTDAIKKFREERNTLLDKSDKYVTPDYPHRFEKDIQDWIDYRRALRDLPRTARPTLDADGNLKDVEWPVVPTP